MRGVERDDVPRSRRHVPQRGEAPVGEDAGDDVVAQARVVEAAFLLHRQERQRVHERAREEPDPGARGRPPFVAVEFHPFHATGGRGALEHVARERAALELLHAPPGELVHAKRVVGAAGDAPQARRLGIAHEPDRLPGHAHAHLHLRADRHPREMPREHAGDVRILLVAAVVADLLAQEAGGDPDPDGQVGRAPGGEGGRHQPAR